MKIKQQKERKKVLLLQKNKQQVELKISTAKNLLRKDALSQQSINKALKIHAELTTLAPQDPRTEEIFKQIISSHSTLANTQKEAADFPEALNSINQGLALDRQIRNYFN